MSINKILKEEDELIKPGRGDIEKINNICSDFSKKLKKELKKKKINAEVFIGGSLSKNTIVKKDKYDIDVFVRFSRKYNEKKISELLEQVLRKKAKKVHGSRDYYQKIVNEIIIEIIPVMKIKKPEQAMNVTDLSYFHVNYIAGKLRNNKELSDEIRLAKTFCFAQDCYGAESYINGFSGYALELLVCHYRSFLKFVKEIAKTNALDKIIIDDNKFYKNKREILRELNESKLQSPIILIDPTFKQRNAAASLSKETFLKFQKACRQFLKKPSLEFFKKKNILDDFSKFRDRLKIVGVKTRKQAGDVAGTKSKKFFDFFIGRLTREFKTIKHGFDYNKQENKAGFYLVLEKKQDEIIKGPPVTSVENLRGFKKAHPNAFIKKGFAYAKIKHDLSFEKWFKIFLKKGKKIIKEMSIKEIKLVD